MSEMGVVYEVNANWDEFWIRFIFRPIVAMVFSAVAFALINPLYSRAVTTTATLQKFHLEWVGTADNEKVAFPGPLMTVYVVQFVGSMFMLLEYIHETYYRRENVTFLEEVFFAFFVCHSFLHALQNMFSPGLIFSVEMMTDFFTIVPFYFHTVPNRPFGQHPDWEWGDEGKWSEYLAWSWNTAFRGYDTKPGDASTMWLSFAFLRARRAATAFDGFSARVMPDEWKGGREFEIAASNIAIYGLGLILGWAGLCMTFEILGEPEFLQWSRIETAMGNLSFIQMFYWTMTTISTVGYGDFSPTTTISRFLMCYVFVAGIIYFGAETANIVELNKYLTSGKGRYKAHDSDFVVLSGLGIDGEKNFLIPGFVSEIFHDDHANDEQPLPLSENVPTFIRKIYAYFTQRQGFRDLIFLVEPDDNMDHHLDKDYREWVTAHVDTQKRPFIFFFEGSIEERTDCDRISLPHAYMCFIIPDAQAARSFGLKEKLDHDLKNIMKAMAVRRNAENVKLRLCLLSSNKTQATSFGLDPLNVLALGQVTAALTAASVRIWGCIPMLNGLLWTLHDSEVEDLKLMNYADMKLHTIMSEYLDGCGNQMYGLKLHRAYAGKKMRDVVRKVWEKYGMLIIATQIKGALLLNPDCILEKHQIVFVLAKDNAQVSVLKAVMGETWDVSFVNARRNAASKALDFSNMTAADHERMVCKSMGDDGRVKETYLGEMDGDMALKKIEMSAFAANEARAEQTANMATNVGKKISSFFGRGRKGVAPDKRLNEEIAYEAIQEAAMMASSGPGSFGSDNSVADVPDSAEPARLHVFTVVIGDQSWQDVIFTLGRILADTHGRELRLTVVAEKIPQKTEDTLLSMGCYVFLGTLSNGPKLIQAGLLSADVVIVSNGTRRDAEVLSKLCTIKKLQIHSCSDQAFVLCELKHGLQSLDVYTYVTRYHYMTRATGKKILSLPVGTSFIKGDDSGMAELGEALSSHESYLAGGTMMADIFGYVMARMVYLPATIELFSVMLQPTEEQPAVLSQVRAPPKFHGKKYGELVRHWLNTTECIIALGLYRTREIDLVAGDTTDVRYFATMPEFDKVIDKEDYVTVIAPRGWIAMMGRKRLVRCGRDPNHGSSKRGKKGDLAGLSEQSGASGLAAAQTGAAAMTASEMRVANGEEKISL